MSDDILTRWYFDPGENAVTVQRVQDVTDIIERNKELAKEPNPKGDKMWHKWSLPNAEIEKLFFKYSEGDHSKTMDDEFWKWVDKIVMSDADYLHFRTGNRSNPFTIGYSK